MPAPIMPAPSTPILLIGVLPMPSGRDPPPLMCCRSKKNAWIMFLATWPVTSWVKYRLSMRLAVSKSTWAPSTAASRMARGAGIGAPLSCFFSSAGNDGRTPASAGLVGVPPGIL